MGLLDDIMKSLEEAQRQAEGRPPARRAPPQRPQEREQEEEDEELVDEADSVRRQVGPSIERMKERARRQNQAQVEAAAAQAEAVLNKARAQTAADARVVVQAVAKKGVPPARRLATIFHHRSSVRDAILVHEVLGTPPGLRRFKAMRRRG